MELTAYTLSFRGSSPSLCPICLDRRFRGCPYAESQLRTGPSSELQRHQPNLWVHMYVVQSNNDDSALLDLISTRQDQVPLCCATRLVRRVVSTLHLFNELVELREIFQQFWRHLCIVVEVVIDQFLEQASLHAIVCHKAVEKP